jgi:surfeit locus 1 family protein
MPARLRSLLLPAVLVCLGLAMLVSLGNWQVRRLAWKEDLIARVTERPASEPLDLREESLENIGEPSSFLENNLYRPMLLTGEYRPDGESLVFTSLIRPRGRFGGPGYWVMTPFVTPRGAVILVNRGFVPDGMRNAYAPPPGEELTIKGLIRAAEEGSWLTPDAKLDERIFFSRNPSEIARATGVSEGLDYPGGSRFITFFIDLDASYTPASGLPQPGETRFSFPNNHLQYAITWYGLAVALLAVFAVFAWRRLKEPQAERLTPPGRRT